MREWERCGILGGRREEKRYVEVRSSRLIHRWRDGREEYEFVEKRVVYTTMQEIGILSIE